MKHFLITFLFAANVLLLHAQQSSADQWKPLLDQPKLAAYFSGIFNDLGIHVIETDEAFTVHHKGDHFEITDGIEPSEVDFVLDIPHEKIERMLLHGEDATIDEAESFLILGVLFSPMTQASLNTPFLTKRKNLKAGGVEALIHVLLLDPDGKNDQSHTLAFAGDQWLVIPGLHGEAKRTFRLDPQHALDYQRKLFEAKRENTSKAWRSFAKWYKTWREDVSSE